MAFSVVRKLFRGLSRTRENIAGTLRSVVGRAQVDEEALEDLEASLLAADLGPELTGEVLGAVRRRAQQNGTDAGGLRLAVHEALRAAFPDEPLPAQARHSPHVVFVVGVNGGGKTTTAGKLAALERAAGRRVILVAADTFRAAAIDQLECWADRAGVELVKQREGADPASVVYDALHAARTRGVDTVLVDTAGRLHTKSNLMAELQKIARVAAREVEGAPHEVLLIVDATTGQNGLLQAASFAEAAPLTGVVLTKLDGTAKGGVALGIHRRLNVPVQYVGVGEALDDLLPFDADNFVNGLLGGDGAENR